MQAGRQILAVSPKISAWVKLKVTASHPTGYSWSSGQVWMGSRWPSHSWLQWKNEDLLNCGSSCHAEEASKRPSSHFPPPLFKG